MTPSAGGCPRPGALAPASRTLYAIYLRPLDAVAQIRAAELRRRHVLMLRDAIAAARGDGAAAAFVRTVSALYAWAIERDRAEVNPARRIRPTGGGHHRAWTEVEIAHALARLPEHLRRVVVLALCTGQRRGDLVRLTWTACAGGRVRLTQAKTGTSVSIPVHPALAAELARWRADTRTVTVLAHSRGGPWTADRLTAALRAALERIGLGGITLHGLRASAARRLAEAGATAHEIAAVTGHRTLALVQHYTEAADRERLADRAIGALSIRPPTNAQTARKNRAKSDG